MKKLKLSLLCTSLLAATGCMEASNNQETPENKPASALESVSQTSQSEQNDFERLAARIIKQDIKGKSYLDKALPFVESQSDDGSWPDIIYDDDTTNNWAPGQHLNRLMWMAFAYSNATHEEKQNPEFTKLKQAIIKGLDSWFTIKPVSKNWWWNEIGPQLRLGPVGLAMGDELSDEQKANIAGLMPQEFAERDKGANLTDKAKGILVAGILLKDKDKIAYALKGIENSIFTSAGPGIQPDFSYHLHGAHLYNGSYGKVYINTALFYAHAVNDLAWRFAPEKNEILASYVLDGVRWMTRSGTIDHQTRGRDISRKKADEPTNDGLLKQLDLLSELTPNRNAEIERYRTHLEGGIAGLNGFKHFWRSDYSTNMKDEFLFAVKMSSDGVTTTESGNKENTLGYWLSHGSTALMLDGSEYRNIFAAWDWRYVPGVTASDYQGPAAAWGKYEHRSSFVGGVSNGKHGITTMDMKQRGIRAKKSWFHFDDEIVALGADISSNQDLEISTTLEQSILQGPVVIDNVTVDKNGDHPLDKNTSWVHHNHIGYVFPENVSAIMSNKSQSGNWKTINKGQSEETITKDVFTLRISHGSQPQGDTYQYILVPAKSAADVKQYAADLPVRIVKNTKDVQAVQHDELKQTSIVFHQAGSVEINDDLVIAVNKPSAIVIDSSNETLSVAVATPGISGGELELCINDNVEHFTMPEGDDAGKSITKAFKGTKGSCTKAIESLVTNLQPTDDAFVRGGHKNKDANFGNHDFLEVAAESGDTDDKPVTRWDGVSYNPGISEAFLRWDLSALDASKIEKVQVKLHAQQSDNAAKTSLSFHKASDSWGEQEMTGWYAGSIISSTIKDVQLTKQSQAIILDITDYAKDELNGDQLLTLAIRGNNKNSVAKIASKEHSDDELKPQLLIKYKL